MKEQTKNAVKSLIISLLTAITIICAVIMLMYSIGLALWLRITASIILFTIGFGLLISKILKKSILTKIFIICDILALVILLCYYIIWANNWLIYFKSVESIQNLILSTGIWGEVVFTLIQFLQVAVLPIPAMITTLAGVAIYGPFKAMILSLIGIILGSTASFGIGRIFGRPLCEWVAGKETTEKYMKLLNDKGKFLLPVMFVLPVFPDDILCMIAGITNMSWRFFISSVLIFRPISVIATCYVGSGELIPFSGWGLIVWPFIIAFLIFAFWFCFKYQSKIENYFKTKFSKYGKIEKNVENSNSDIKQDNLLNNEENKN